MLKGFMRGNEKVVLDLTFLKMAIGNTMEFNYFNNERRELLRNLYHAVPSRLVRWK
jgi:hypothetical protein